MSYRVEWEKDIQLAKGRELNSAATLASQPAAGHCNSLSFIVNIVIMDLGWGLFVGLVAESCSRIWLPCLIGLELFRMTSVKGSGGKTSELPPLVAMQLGIESWRVNTCITEHSHRTRTAAFTQKSHHRPIIVGWSHRGELTLFYLHYAWSV